MSRSSSEPPLSHLVVDALFGFLATVVMMLAVLFAVGAWAMEWPVIFVGALAVALLAHAAHRRGLLQPSVSFGGAIGHSLIELAPLAGGVVVAVSLATGATLWAAIGLVIVFLGLIGNFLS